MTLPPPDSRAFGRELPQTLPEAWELVAILTEALHQATHSLGLIAADVHALRQALDRHEPTLAALKGGGILAARAQMRYARKHPEASNSDHPDPPGAGTGRGHRP